MIGEEIEPNSINVDKLIVPNDIIPEKIMARSTTPVEMKVRGSRSPLIKGQV